MLNLTKKCLPLIFTSLTFDSRNSTGDSYMFSTPFLIKPRPRLENNDTVLDGHAS